MDSMRDLLNNSLLLECHLDDQMWGYAIRMAMEMSDKTVQQSDRILHCLFNIRIFDWASFDVWGPEGIWSMRYSALLGHQLFKMIEEQLTKVC